MPYLRHIAEQGIDRLRMKARIIYAILSLYKCLPWCLKCCAFINLGEINAFTLSTILSRIKPVQQYGQLKLVTMEMEKLYSYAAYVIKAMENRDYGLKYLSKLVI